MKEYLIIKAINAVLKRRFINFLFLGKRDFMKKGKLAWVIIIHNSNGGLICGESKIRTEIFINSKHGR